MAYVVWVSTAPLTDWRPSADSLKNQDLVFRVGRADLNKFAMASAICDTVQQKCNIDVATVPEDHVVGVALVQPKFCYDELQCLEPHEKLQYSVYRRLKGSGLVGCMYFFNILDVAPLPVFSPVFNIMRHSRRHFFFKFENGQTEHLLAELESTAAGVPPWLANEPCEWCVRLPKPFALLCGQGHWPSFAVADLKGRYKGWGICGVREDSWLDLFTAARWPLDVNKIMDAAVASEAADHVRRIAALLVPGTLPQATLQAALQQANKIACSLQSHVDDLMEFLNVDAPLQAHHQAYIV